MTELSVVSNAVQETGAELCCRLFTVSNIMNYLEDTSPCPLSEEESRLAYGAKQKALDVLKDALKKKYSVLMENAGENGNSVGRSPSLTPHLVHSLRTELEQVTFVKVDHPFYAICYIYPRSHERTIYLGPRFWKQGEILEEDSRPGLLIKKAAQFLFHKTSGAVPVGQGTVGKGQRHEPRLLSANQIRSEFETVLKHWGIYTDHFYSCCGETARDSVCKDSYSSSRPWLLSETERKVTEEAKQRTLMILFNALEKKDSLLVEKSEDFVSHRRLKMCPLIPLHLVQDLITNLQKVTFRKRYNANHKNFYILPDANGIVIYLSPDFWQQNEMLACRSRPGTLILELSQVLGYKRYLERPTEVGEGNKDPPMFSLTASNICWAFETWMIHKGFYHRSYSCCGEESKDSVCALSDLSACLNDIMVPPEIPERRSFKTKSMRREPITQTSSGLGECSRSLLPEYAPKGLLLSEEERKVAEKAKQRTLRILFNALEKKDSLLVVKPEDFVGIPKKKTFPLIPLNLVQDLIINLLSVTFKKSKCVIPETFELLPGSDEIIIYLSPHFWHQREMLGQGSRPGTLILELSLVLGYKRYLGSPTDEREQQDQQKFPLTASEICSVFEKWMCHSGSYFGYYSCCGEKSVDSVCDILTGASHHIQSDME